MRVYIADDDVADIICLALTSGAVLDIGRCLCLDAAEAVAALTPVDENIQKRVALPLQRLRLVDADVTHLGRAVQLAPGFTPA